MEQTLLHKDMIDYIWYVRAYILVSSVSPMIESDIDFCSFCGKCIGEEAVHHEYEEAYDQALEEDTTLPDDEAKLESFRTQFLINLEAAS